MKPKPLYQIAESLGVTSSHLCHVMKGECRGRWEVYRALRKNDRPLTADAIRFERAARKTYLAEGGK